MSIPLSQGRVGIYVDGAHVSVAGGHGLRYDVLRDFAMRDGAEPSRMNLYVSYDAERARDDGGYRRGQENFCSVLRDFGYKVVQRDLAGREDESGNRFLDAGCTTALAIDALDQADGFDRIVMVAGSPELVVLVRALQARGCRVEVVGFEDTSPALRAEADLFLPA
ncbi:NYN domain-containing protein, partial [bacterium]|nr:NYN domain-containing protein [bacterium]